MLPIPWQIFGSSPKTDNPCLYLCLCKPRREIAQAMQQWMAGGVATTAPISGNNSDSTAATPAT